jgi:UDP-N-acetylglucosamine--N-acetylmuramyl-(pentapeptide) pyrophosphoryl-undecaprenol N-acetylglucosamine transferase
MNVLFAGGGTGGHVYPALAVAEALLRREPGARILFAGSRAGMEASIVPRSGLPFAGLAVRPPRSRAPIRVAVSVAGIGASLVQAFAVLAQFRPSVVIATGGVAAVPTVLAAAVLNVPVVVLEGNAVPGRTNRWLARYSRVIAVSADEATAGLPAGRAVVTGLPVRRDVYTVTREAGCAAFGLQPARKTVLAIGGSQGAVHLNRAVEDAARRLASRGDLQVLHQLGGGWSGTSGDRAVPEAGAEIGYRRVAYLEQMGPAYACADLVVSRCGANALAEIAACGLPAILVPYPFAADDHQARNAAPLVAAGAAVLILDAELTGSALATQIASILDTPGRLAAMAAAARSQGRPDAADRVVALIAQLTQPLAEGVRG